MTVDDDLEFLEAIRKLEGQLDDFLEPEHAARLRSELKQSFSSAEDPHHREVAVDQALLIVAEYEQAQIKLGELLGAALGEKGSDQRVFTSIPGMPIPVPNIPGSPISDPPKPPIEVDLTKRPRPGDWVCCPKKPEHLVTILRLPGQSCKQHGSLLVRVKTTKDQGSSSC